MIHFDPIVGRFLYDHAHGADNNNRNSNSAYTHTHTHARIHTSTLQALSTVRRETVMKESFDNA